MIKCYGFFPFKYVIILYMKLLIADDEKLTREGLKNGIAWEELGIDEIRLAHDGRDALRIAETFLPDIVLTDVRMPHMDGIEMAKALKERFPELSVIFMSGYSDREYLKAAIRLRAVSYVEKPIHLNEVSAAVAAAAKECGEREILHRIEAASPELNDTPVPVPRETDSTHVDLIRSYVKAHYSDTALSIKAISDHVRLSPSYICTLFKSETGETLNQYITRFRMEKAREALSDPRNKVADIAEEVGFTDSNYFSKAFKKSFGLSPTEFRQAMTS